MANKKLKPKVGKRNGKWYAFLSPIINVGYPVRIGYPCESLEKALNWALKSGQK